MTGELHYFHPVEVAGLVSRDVCAKCDEGYHAAPTRTQPIEPPPLPPGAIVPAQPDYTLPPPTEQTVVLQVFTEMLRAATGDGGRKRAAGTKPPWWRDVSHEPAIFSHLNKWKHGERVDHDSGVHPLVHLAWRALAVAYQETRGMVDPVTAQAPGAPVEPDDWRV